MQPNQSFDFEDENENNNSRLSDPALDPNMNMNNSIGNIQ